MVRKQDNHVWHVFVIKTEDRDKLQRYLLKMVLKLLFTTL